MTASETRSTALGLHACCGPCSLMPVRQLRAAGFTPHIYYCNPNIAPDGEYRKRYATLLGWAADASIDVEEIPMDHEQWVAAVGAPYEAAMAAGVDETAARQDRCRRCYRLRFEAVARRCAEEGVGVLSTTLTVSPYQYGAIIAEELEAAARREGLTAHCEDFRPWYSEATRTAIALGLYRQNYCGCEYSAAEAAREREARAAARAEARLMRQAERRPEREAEARAREERARERQAYEQKRARQREVRRALRGL